MPALEAIGSAHWEFSAARGAGSPSGSGAAALEDAVGVALGRVGSGRVGHVPGARRWAGGRRAGGGVGRQPESGPGAGAVAAVLVSIVVSIPACHAGDRGSIPRRGGNTPSFGGWRRSLSCRLAPKGPSSPPSALQRGAGRQRVPSLHTVDRLQPFSPSSSPGAQLPRQSEGLLWTPQALDDVAARPKWLSQEAPCVATQGCTYAQRHRCTAAGTGGRRMSGVPCRCGKWPGPGARWRRALASRGLEDAYPRGGGGPRRGAQGPGAARQRERPPEAVGRVS